MTRGPYFTLDKDRICVYGARRAAIYNLDTGDVFSIDPVSAKIIEQLEAGKTIPEVVSCTPGCSSEQILQYLEQLKENQLGSFLPTFEKKEKISLSTDPYLKIDYIWLELRENCNLKCIHCYSESTDSKKKPVKRLSYQEWKRTIQEAYEMGCRNLQFIGGEPLLYGEKLFGLAAYARELGYRELEIFSNLILLKDRWIDLMEKFQIRIATSVHSAKPAIHDSITQKEGSFNKAIAAIQKLKDRNIPLRFGFTIMKHNQDYVEETMEFLRQLGDRDPIYDIVRPCGRAKDEHLASAKYRYIRDKALFLKVKKDDFIKRYRGNGCWQGRMAISSSGDVMPCIMKRDNPAGNIKEMPLKDIIRGKLQEYWGLSRDKITTCKDCEYRYVCRDCRPVAYGPTGELIAKDPGCLYDPYKGEFIKI